MTDDYGASEADIRAAKKRLMEIYDLVHEAVRMLKIGESGTISLGKFSREEVQSYLIGYGGHKKKWFDATYDKTSRALRVTRGKPLPHDKPKKESKEEVP